MKNLVICALSVAFVSSTALAETTVIKREAAPSTVVVAPSDSSVEKKTVVHSDDMGCKSKSVTKSDDMGNSKTVAKSNC